MYACSCMHSQLTSITVTNREEKVELYCTSHEERMTDFASQTDDKLFLSLLEAYF